MQIFKGLLKSIPPDGAKNNANNCVSHELEFCIPHYASFLRLDARDASRLSLFISFILSDLFLRSSGE